LQADLETARIFGREEILSVLRKIYGMGLPDVIATQKLGFGSHFSGKPSVAERIANLCLAK
jgi:Zn-dependent protease with chaperone function